MYEVKMPRLSDSMEVGQIIEWKVEEGDRVEQGQNLADIESDKAVMELECFHDGTIKDIVYEDGDEVEVGEVIAHIDEAGEEAGKAADEGEKEREEEEPEPEEHEEEPEPVQEESEPEPKEESEPEPEEEGQAEEKPPEPETVVSDDETEPAERRGEQDRIKISPYARKLAQEKGIDYAGIEGSGPGGRIIARDIEGKSGEKSTPEGGEEPHVEKPKKSTDGSDEELLRVELEEGEAEVEKAPFRQRTQARYVTAAKHVVPHFYITRSVEVTELVERKEELKDNFNASLTHVIMLACLKTLAEHPNLNRSYEAERIINWNDINVGLAVDTDNGLTVAVLREASELGLEEIVERTSELVEKARDNRLSAEERKHPTFVITNLGMFGVEEFQAILNPPAPITVAVSAALPRPVVRDGSVEPGNVMKLTLSCDHRIVEGAAAAEFLRDLGLSLEDPDSFLSSG